MIEYFHPALIDDDINPQILKRARYEANGLKFCNRVGLGCVPDVENIAYMGSIILMKPSTFLSVVPPLHGFVKTIEYLRTGQETVFGTPFLDIDIDEETSTAQIKGHEGRSRMSYFKSTVDDAPIPVALFIRQNNGTLRARHIEPWMLDLIQAGVRSERTEISQGEFVTGPIFDQAAYLDKSDVVCRVSPSSQSLMPKF